jgi:hypothetical protein
MTLHFIESASTTGSMDITVKMTLAPYKNFIINAPDKCWLKLTREVSDLQDTSAILITISIPNIHQNLLQIPVATRRE